MEFAMSRVKGRGGKSLTWRSDCGDRKKLCSTSLLKFLKNLKEVIVFSKNSFSVAGLKVIV